AGGVCLTWNGHVARVADSLPAAPIAVIPATRVSTAASRGALPDSLPRADAVFTVARAALLGAALASGDASLFGASADDRLHEPYRAAAAPHLAELRAALPDGALGATLSGSGPTVIVWARPDERDRVAAELDARYAEHEIVPLPVSATGAGTADGSSLSPVPPRHWDSAMSPASAGCLEARVTRPTICPLRSVIHSRPTR